MEKVRGERRDEKMKAADLIERVHTELHGHWRK